jgi:hypothetical protein
MDHLEGATYRDYGTKPKHRRSEINNGGTEADHAAAAENENSAHSSELMAETLKRLYDEKAPEQTVKEAAEVVTEVADKAAEEAAAPAAETMEKAAEVSPETAEAVKEALQARAEETTGRRRRSKG